MVKISKKQAVKPTKLRTKLKLIVALFGANILLGFAFQNCSEPSRRVANTLSSSAKMESREAAPHAKALSITPTSQ